MSSFMMKTYYGHYGKAKQNRIFLSMQGQTNLCLLAGGGGLIKNSEALFSGGELS